MHTGDKSKRLKTVLMLNGQQQARLTNAKIMHSMTVGGACAVKLRTASVCCLQITRIFLKCVLAYAPVYIPFIPLFYSSLEQFTQKVKSSFSSFISYFHLK